ncbi:MAG: hypothetical protein RJQ14_17070 [Marinoscillum sp.]
MGKLKGVGLIVCLAVVVPVFGQSYRAELEDLLSQSPFIMELSKANQLYGVDLVGSSNLFQNDQNIVFKTVDGKSSRTVGNYNLELEKLLIYYQDRTYVIGAEDLQSFYVTDSLNSARNFEKTSRGMLEVLFADTSQSITLYKDVEVAFTGQNYNSRIGVGRSYDKYIKENKYYISKGVGINPVNSWNAFLQYMAPKQGDIREFIKVNKLTFSNERHLIHVIGYYADLISSTSKYKSIHYEQKIVKLKVGGQLASYSNSYNYYYIESIGIFGLNWDYFTSYYQDSGRHFDPLLFIEASFYLSKQVTIGFQYVPFKYYTKSKASGELTLSSIYPETHPWYKPDTVIVAEGSLTHCVKWHLISPTLTFEKILGDNFKGGLNISYTFGLWDKDEENYQTNNFSGISGGLELTWKDLIFLRYQYVPLNMGVRAYNNDQGETIHQREFEISGLNSISVGISYTLSFDRETLILTD